MPEASPRAAVAGPGTTSAPALSERQFFIQLKGDPLGPLSASELQDLASKGCLNSQTPVSENGAAWKPFGELTELLSPLQPAPRFSLPAAPPATSHALVQVTHAPAHSSVSSDPSRRRFVLPLWAIELIAAALALAAGLLAFACIHLVAGGLAKRFPRLAIGVAIFPGVAVFAIVRNLFLTWRTGVFRMPLAAALEGVILTPDGRHAVTLGADRMLRMWNVQSGREISVWAESHHAGTALSLSQADQSVWVSCADGLVCAFRLQDPRQNRTLDPFDGEPRLRSRSPVACLATSSDGRWIAAGCDDGIIRVLSLAGDNRILRLKGTQGKVRGVGFATDCRRLISGGEDGLLRVWDGESGALLQSLRADAGRLWSVATLPQWPYVLAGGDGVIWLWDLARGTPCAVMAGHSGPVMRLAVSANGAFAASGGSDGSVRLWDIERAVQLACFLGHRGVVTGVALSPDGRTIVSCSRDRTVRSWMATA